MPIRNQHRIGDYLMVDDESGMVHYHSQMRRLWDGTWRHAKNFETRQPQEFVLARSDPRALRHIRPDDVCSPIVCLPTFVGNTTISTRRDGPAASLFDICTTEGAGDVTASVSDALAVQLSLKDTQIPRVSTPVTIDSPLEVSLSLQDADTGDLCGFSTVTFLIGFDGIQDNNSFTDESLIGSTILTTGDFHSQVNSPGPKFGTAAGTGSINSIGGDTAGTLGYIEFEDEENITDFDSGDFVIEGWLRTDLGFGTNTTETIMSKNKAALWTVNNGFFLYMDTSTGFIRWSTDNQDGIVITTTDYRGRDWTYYTLERFNGTTYAYTDGVLEDTSTASWELVKLNEEIYMGLKANNKTAPTQFTGLYDEWRISKCARYFGSNFTPPSTKHPRV